MADIPADLTWIRAAPEGEEGPGPGSRSPTARTNSHLRETCDPENVVTTTTTKWDAFTKGVVAVEFDHFAELDGEGPVAPS